MINDKAAQSFSAIDPHFFRDDSLDWGIHFVFGGQPLARLESTLAQNGVGKECTLQLLYPFDFSVRDNGNEGGEGVGVKGLWRGCEGSVWGVWGELGQGGKEWVGWLPFNEMRRGTGDATNQVLRAGF